MPKPSSAATPHKETTISVQQFLNDMDAILDRVNEHNEVFIIQKSGKCIAAIIPPHEYFEFRAELEKSER